MSTILMTVTDSYIWLAQGPGPITNPTPQAPPLADKLMLFIRYLTWFAILSGITAIIYAGGRFAWEKWSGSSLQSPKMVAGAMIGGVIATSAGTLMNAVLGT